MGASIPMIDASARRRRTILITGATGLIGRALTTALRADGIRVRSLSRQPQEDGAFEWDPARGRLDDRALEGVDAVVHLAGRSIAAGRWSPRVRAEILDSRVKGTSLLCAAMTAARSLPPTLVSASAVGYYGDRGDAWVDEHDGPGEGFLADVCVQWEAAAAPVRLAGARVAHPRLGMVLSAGGGALKTMLTPFRLGAGGPIGTGRQWISWIHLADAVAVLRRLLDDDHLAGPVNAVTPEPVRNAEFGRALGAALHRPAVLPLPAFAVRLMLGEMGERLLLDGARVRPAALTGAGFTWSMPAIEDALERELDPPAEASPST